MKKPLFDKEGLKRSLQSRTFRVGSYSAFISVIALVLAVAINLLVAEVPARYLKTDMTEQSLYSISQQTKSLVGGLTEDVTVYLVAQTGREDEVIREMLAQYGDLSDRLKIVYKDPVLYPGFAGSYTDDSVYDNSLIVESDKRFKLIPYNEIYVTQYDYSSYYTTGQATSTTSYNGEGVLTSAIDFVTNDKLPHVYTLTGHGEAVLTDRFKRAVERENMTLADLSLITQKAVPADCSCLLIAAPRTDLSKDERELILNYMKSGGKVVMYSDYSTTDLVNFEYIGKEYGLELLPGLVLETDDNMYMQGYSYYLLPTIGADEITDPISQNNYRVLAPLSGGLQESEQHRSTVTVKPLLSTSANAYMKVRIAEGDAVTQTEEDLQGQFLIGAKASETYNEVTATLIWYTSAGLLNDSVDQASSGAVSDLFINTLGSLCEKTESISIHAKSMDYSFLSLTSAQVGTISLILIGAVPLLFVAVGVYVFVRRKKR